MSRGVRRVMNHWLAQAGLILGFIGLQLLGVAAIKLSLAGLALWALRGPRHALQSLSLVWILPLLHPALLRGEGFINLQRDQAILLLKWSVLLAAAGSCLAPVVLRRRPVPATAAWATLFVVTAGIASAVTSVAPDVSLTKLAAFWLGATTVLVGFHASAAQARQHHEWFTALAAALVLANAALLQTPWAYRAYDHLFCGLFAHPQFTALVMATVLAWLGGRCLVEERLPVALVALVACAFVVLWRTGSRTALFALGLGLVTALLLRWLLARPPLRATAAAVLRSRNVAAVVLAAMAVVFAGGSLTGSLAQFVQKRSAYHDQQAELWTSREHMIRAQWRNFLAQPAFGNGFGIASNASTSRLVRDPTTSIALSAPTEKGFLPTAVLEETGVVGATLLGLMLFSLAVGIARAARFPRLWMAATAGFVNLGESVFFSFGGVGMFLWLMIAFATLPEPD